MAKQRQYEAVGSLWQQTTRQGDTYFFGTITLPDGTALPVQIYANQFKSDYNNLPDWVVYVKKDALDLMEESAKAEQPI